MDKSVLMDANIDKGTEVGNVGHDARQFHALYEVVDRFDALGKLKLLYLLARVTAGLLQLLHDVGQRGQSHVASHIFL